MNSLVAYDSSEEEDEPQSVKPSKIQGNPSPCKSENHTKPTTPPKADHLPMIGPSIPSNISQSYDDYDEEHETKPPESERDMIRYLTQASHPMTEIPASPSGSPNASSSARIKHFLDLKAKGIHFNEDLARKSAFKNPSLLQNLIDRAGLDIHSAYRTSLPPNVFDTTALPAAGYKEQLLTSQQAIRAKEEANKKVQAAAGKRTVDFNSGGVSITPNEFSSNGGLQKRPKQ